MKPCFPLILGIVLLAGCTQQSDSGPIKIGPDTYTIATRSASYNGIPANTMALREASNYCSSGHQVMMLDRIQGSDVDAQIFFYCLAPNDSRLVQQHMRSVPTGEANTYSLPQAPVQQPPPPPAIPQAVIVPQPEPQVVQTPEKPVTVHRVAKPNPKPTSGTDLDQEINRLRQHQSSPTTATAPPSPTSPSALLSQ